jgi:hypothetical protein
MKGEGLGDRGQIDTQKAGSNIGFLRGYSRNKLQGKLVLRCIDTKYIRL